MNYARRQQYRRLSRAATAALVSGVSMLLALAVAGAGAVSAAGAILVLAVGLGLYARHWLALADRSRVGARSEDEVRRALAPLESEGWRLRHSPAWRGRGDIDSLAIGPTGLGFAIETKTRTYDDRHLARVERTGSLALASTFGGGVGAAPRRWSVLFARVASSGLSTACS